MARAARSRAKALAAVALCLCFLALPAARAPFAQAGADSGAKAGGAGAAADLASAAGQAQAGAAAADMDATGQDASGTDASGGADGTDGAEGVEGGAAAATAVTLETASGAKASAARPGYELALGYGELGVLTPLESFVYRYEAVLAERAAIAEQKRLEREEALKLAKEEQRKAEARKHVAGLTEAELDELFSDDYYVERMRALGFYRDEFSDGGLNYRNGVIRLQSSINHPVSAQMDAITKKALVEDSPVIPIDEVSAAAADGYWITINKSRNILTVYNGESVHKKYPVATGASASLTPEGKFSFVSKAVNPAWGGGGYASPVAGGSPSNPLGKRWMGLNIGGGGRYGVHGNASPRSIGTYASHGCVRMINPDVEELFEYIPVGTPVWIGTDAKLKEMGVAQYHNDPAADAELAAQAEAAAAKAAEGAGERGASEVAGNAAAGDGAAGDGTAGEGPAGAGADGAQAADGQGGRRGERGAAGSGGERARLFAPSGAASEL
jgi:lipoprotein-anchoring transpeptidase ErfK/SrfK